MGVPVVTTTIGAENINAIDSKDWIVADSDNEFAEAIIKLFRDKNKSEEIMNNGFDFMTENFTWKAAEKRFEFLRGIIR